MANLQSYIDWASQQTRVGTVHPVATTSATQSMWLKGASVASYAALAPYETPLQWLDSQLGKVTRVARV